MEREIYLKRVVSQNIKAVLALIFVVFLLQPRVAECQSKSNPFDITGVVVDENGDPVIGATVVVGKDNNKAALTNTKGEFSLKSVTARDILYVSCLGMEKKSVTIGAATHLKITLRTDIKAIDDVVVTGYGGTVRRGDLTGSIQSINNRSFSDQSMTTMEEALSGRIAGVMVNANSAPGGGISMQIRGTNSMLGSTEPLYVVDGFPMEPNTDAAGNSGTSEAQSSLNFLNPNDIESITVLKDASATAIYGARGANGVVLVTTKSGKEGSTQVVYSGKFGWSHVTKQVDMLSAEEYANFKNQQELNRYYVQTTALEYGVPLWDESISEIDPITLEFVKPWELGRGTNWQDAIFRTAFNTDHNVSIRGGTDKMKLSASFGYTKQNGIVINSDYERFTFSGSMDYRATRHLKFKNRTNLSRGTGKSLNVGNNNVGDTRSIITAALWTNPTFELYKEIDESIDQDVVIENGERMTNPYMLAKYMSDDKVATSVNNVTDVEYSLVPGLLATGTVAVSYFQNKRSQYWPSTISRGRSVDGEAFLANNESLKYMLGFRLNYNKTFNKIHKFDAMLSTSIEEVNYNDFSQRYTGFNDDELGYNAVKSAKTTFPASTSVTRSRLVSFVGRVNYNLKNRYLFTATFRADGSSRAALDEKFGYFPSVAAAWRISEEPWFKSFTKVVDNFKIRASYGETGSQPNGTYRSLTTMTPTNAPFGDALYGAIYENGAGNPLLTWETTKQANVGLDLSFFRTRLNITLDYYDKRTEGLLQDVRLAPSSGWSSVQMNLGEIQNRGFEFTVSGALISRRNHELTMSVNGAFNRNKLLDLGDREFITGAQIGNTQPNRFIVGQPLGVFYGYKVKGVFKDWAQVLTSDEGIAQRDAMPGEYIIENRYVDYIDDGNGNMIPSPNQKINDQDMTVIGDPNPDFTFGMSLNYKYKNFDFSVLLTGSLGGDIFWGDFVNASKMMGQSANQLKYVYDHSWVAPITYELKGPDGKPYIIGSKEGRMDGAYYPRAYNQDKEAACTGYNEKRNAYRPSTMNSKYVLDGSYLKIQTVSLGYTFRNLKIVKNLRVSFAVSNLHTFCNYPGFDPTVISFASAQRRGIDQGGYPTQRTYSANIQINF